MRYTYNSNRPYRSRASTSRSNRTVVPSGSKSCMNWLASGPKHCTGLVGCFVSGVSMPMRRIDSVLPPMRISMVSPSITCSTVALLGSSGVAGAQAEAIKHKQTSHRFFRTMQCVPPLPPFVGNSLPLWGIYAHMSTMFEKRSASRYLEVRVANVTDSCFNSGDAVTRSTPSVNSATPNQLVELLANPELTDLHDDQIMFLAWSR